MMAVAELLFLENGSLGGLKEHIDAAQHHERQDDLLVVAILEGMHKHIVGNVPDEGEEGIVLFVIHRDSRLESDLASTFRNFGIRISVWRKVS